MIDRTELDDMEAAAMKFEWGTVESEGLRQFKQGVKYMRNNLPLSALQCFRRALDEEQNNPYFLSYFGVALARAEHKWDEAEQICISALRMKRRQPQLYLNLAEVYLKAGKREDAVDVLLEGIHYEPADARLNRMLGKLGIRRSPVVPFLGRANVLNRGLGRLRHRLFRIMHRD
jgi:predicted Zn-dependent protease